MKNLKLYFSTILLFSFISCKYELPEEPVLPAPSAGDVNFSNYVSIGDGNTAGFMHSSLYPEGQENSFPNLLAKKINEVTSLSFDQPIIASPTTGNGFNPVHSVPSINLYFGRLKMYKPACIQSSITATVTPGEAPIPYAGNKAELNNYGVTGLKMLELTVTGYGLANPFFGRFATDPATSSVLGDAAAKQPTFITLWLGNQDVLGYATAGGTGNIEGFAPGDMTAPGLFEGSLFASLNALMPTGSNVKTVIGNIPDVMSWPFFYTVNNSLLSGQKLPFNLTAVEAGGLTQLYTIMGWGNPGFSEGTVNYFTIETATGIRQMNPSEDYILLSTPSDSLGLGPIDPCNPTGQQRGGWGIQKPIPSQFVLDVTEVNNVRTKITAYNSAIEAEVNSRANLVLADMRGLMQQLNTTGVPAGFGIVKASIPFGGAISLDGIHPTPKGSAVFANKFIESINQNFNANLHYLDPGNYKGIEIP